MFIGETDCYTDYRIPAMVISERGIIYVACECRRGDSDWSHIDLCIEKSIDGGAHFRRIKKICCPGKTLNNPVLLVKDQTVHFLYCENYRRVFHMMSTNDGENWSKSEEITKIFGDLTYTVIATGPGHGAVTPDGVMVVPVWLACNPEDEYAHKPSFLITIYSKDDGTTWQRGEVISHENLYDANETAIAIRSNGSVLLSVRNRHPVYRLRYWVTSPNGYSEWEHLPFDERFPDPHCMGSLCSDGERLYFSNCESKEDRENLVLKVSDDDFKTFVRIPISRQAGYSEVAVWKSSVYVLYETFETCGEKRVNHRLHLKQIFMEET